MLSVIWSAGVSAPALECRSSASVNESGGAPPVAVAPPSRRACSGGPDESGQAVLAVEFRSGRETLLPRACSGGPDESGQAVLAVEIVLSGRALGGCATQPACVML